MVAAVSAHSGGCDRLVFDGSLGRPSQRLPATSLLAILGGVLQIRDAWGQEEEGGGSGKPRERIESDRIVTITESR